MSVILSANGTIGVLIDIVLVALVVIIAFVGMAKGFINSLLSIISTAIVIAISVFTAKYVAKFIDGILHVVDFFAKIATKMLNTLGSFFTTPQAADTAGETIVESMPEGIYAPLQKFISKILTNTTFADGQTVAEVVGAALGAIITTIICGIAIFIILKIVFNLLARFFDNVSQKKSIGGMDKLLGLIFGLAKGVILVLFLGSITSILCLVPKINDVVHPIIDQHTSVTKFVYNLSNDINNKYIIENIPDWLASVYK